MVRALALIINLTGRCCERPASPIVHAAPTEWLGQVCTTKNSIVRSPHDGAKGATMVPPTSRNHPFLQVCRWAIPTASQDPWSFGRRDPCGRNLQQVLVRLRNDTYTAVHIATTETHTAFANCSEQLHGGPTFQFHGQRLLVERLLHAHMRPVPTATPADLPSTLARLHGAIAILHPEFLAACSAYGQS